MPPALTLSTQICSCNWSRTGQVELELACRLRGVREWDWDTTGGEPVLLFLLWMVWAPGHLLPFPAIYSDQNPEQCQYDRASTWGTAGRVQSIGLSSTHSRQSQIRHWSYKGLLFIVTTGNEETVKSHLLCSAFAPFSIFHLESVTIFWLQ